MVFITNLQSYRQEKSLSQVFSVREPYSDSLGNGVATNNCIGSKRGSVQLMVVVECRIHRFRMRSTAIDRGTGLYLATGILSNWTFAKLKSGILLERKNLLS